MTANAAEAIKLASGIASVVGIGFGAYRAIRNDLADVEGRLRSDFREDLRGAEERLHLAINTAMARPTPAPPERCHQDRA
jgi:hypothetical protein